MELKDVILSTLAEMEDTPPKPQVTDYEIKEKISVVETIDTIKKEPKIVEEKEDISSLDSELLYLNSIKERLLVLFEGFQAPNNTNIEAKVDMTLNFLEYTLATIGQRVELLEKRKR
jgi:hypothetical protein